MGSDSSGVSGIEYFNKIFMNVCFCCLPGRTERIIINPIKENDHKKYFIMITIKKVFFIDFCYSFTRYIVRLCSKNVNLH